MKIARKNYTASTIFGFAGGFCIGWTLESALGGGDPEWQNGLPSMRVHLYCGCHNKVIASYGRKFFR